MMKNLFFKALGAIAGYQVKLLGWSDELRQFYTSGCRCPECNERLLDNWGKSTVNFYSSTREKISIQGLSSLFRAEWAECPKCNYFWFVKSNNKSFASKTIEILGIEETHRVEESLGTDSRTIDNSKSSIQLTRKFIIRKEWTRAYTVEYEKVRVGRAGFNIGIDEINIKLSLEETIKKKFFIKEETKEIYSEEIEIQVPCSTKINIHFQWKRIWQCGFIKFYSQNGKLSKVPFRVVTCITFDQLQVDD